MAVAVAAVVLVVDLDCEFDPRDIPSEEDVADPRDLLFLTPRNPGGVGSSSVPDFLDSIRDTRLIVGRRWWSNWVHNNPIFIQVAT